ncbi:PXDNL-like protein [Mya arenaria]|uniref:PXDNL-like protein n=1 Tax=Mya arenaria TaxID=6604 RepID=A0ABY7ED36_MYAAR|nr:PXDNL-like protein [Mya arenaria]
MEPAFSPVYVIQNTNRQFRCITSDGNPKATIEWYKNNGTEDRADDTKITSGMKTDSIASGTFVRTSGTLNLTVQKNDQEVGVYCKANNGGDWLYSSNEPSTPKVYYKGFEVTSHVRVISGRSTTLNCNGTGNPSPSYTWTYPGVGPQNGSTLTLASVQTTHAGGVTCTARNTLLPTGGTAVVKTKKTTITLQVLYPSSAPSCTISGTSILTTAILVEGTDNTFSCISSANPPSNTYTWSTPGREQVSGANLTLINVQHTADQGQYTLTATNTMDPTRGNTETGTSNTSFSTRKGLSIISEMSIVVIDETSIPKLYYQDSVVNFPIRVISKRSVTITCSSTGNPNPTYTWTYPGGGRHSGPTLTLARVQTTHTGDMVN